MAVFGALGVDFAPGCEEVDEVFAVSRVDTGKYLDQMAKKVYTVDYLKGEVISAEDHNPELIESV